MYKNVQPNPEKSQKLTQHSCCSMLALGKNLKSRRGNRYRFVQKGETFPTETITLVVRSSGLWEAYTQTCPKWDIIFTTACWCRSMIACQVSWILDEFWIYYNYKIKYVDVWRRATVLWCLNFIPISCMGHKHKPMDTYMILQPMLVDRSMCM